ncbi:MAG: hypothetical protein NXI31_21045 [bacterium]|nr:hypothetical protein [bacterium]
MYTRKKYSLRDLLVWTRHETLIFIAIALTPVVAYDLLDQRWLHLPWLPVALIGTAVAFIISFQNNATYGRLWEARKIWGGITNTTRAWGLQLNDFISGQFTDAEVDDAELHAARRTIAMRHIGWLTALRHTMRQKRPWEDNLAYRTNREWADNIRIHEHHHTIEEDLEGYLEDAERSSVCGRTNHAAQILALQSRHLQQLRTRGWIDDFRHMEMQQTLTQLFDLQGASERIKNFPYPRQYATLNSTFLWIFVILLPFGVMHEFERIGQDLTRDFPTLGPSFVWLSVPFSVVVMWVFHTMERIGRTSENPFEGTPNDVPITTMARGMEIDLREMLGESAETIPDPIPAKHGAQT